MMTANPIIPEPIDKAHYAALLALNERVVEKTAPLNEAKLHRFVTGAVYARQVAQGEGLLIVLDETADFYDSPNFEFFADRHGSFYYVDRIIVGQALTGQGVGRRLYADLTEWIGRSGGGHLCCEVNTQPPNPVSHKFHQAIGFTACGEGSWTGDEGKTKHVHYYEMAIAPLKS